MTKEKNNSTLIGILAIITFLSLIAFVTYASYSVEQNMQNKKDNKLENHNNAITTINEAYSRGNPNAKLTIIEYSDIQCPYCARYHSALKKIIENYPEDIYWVYKHFPLQSHPYAKLASIASECAGEQNLFWEYLDELYINQRKLNPSLITQLADDLNLNTQQFEDCLKSDKYNQKIISNFQEGSSKGITGTPSSLINGQLVKGAQTYEYLEKMIKNTN